MSFIKYQRLLLFPLSAKLCFVFIVFEAQKENVNVAVNFNRLFVCRWLIFFPAEMLKCHRNPNPTGLALIKISTRLLL